MSRLVFVYSIPRETATGIHDWVNTSSGVKMQKVKIGRCDDKIQALYSQRVGGLANHISYTPWIENGEVKIDEQGNRLTLQDKLEQKWNKPKGYFSNRALMKADNLRDEERSYFQRMVWKLNDGCTVFDLDTMDGEMGYYVLLGSSKVANSEREWREHKWPKAEWYIALENESDAIKYQKNEVKSKAFASIHAPEFTESYKRKFVGLLDLGSTRAVITNEQVHNLLYEYIDKSSFLPGSNIEKFMELYRLLNSPHGREELEARYILKQALDNRIVYEKQDTYTWVRPKGQIVIGDKYHEAIDFILNPKKAAEVEELQEMIKAKMA